MKKGRFVLYPTILIILKPSIYCLCPGLDSLRFAKTSFWSWITYGDPIVLRGGLLTKSPALLRKSGFFICLLSKASFARIQTKNPAHRAGLFMCAQDWIVFASLRPPFWRGYNALSRLRRFRAFLFFRLGKRACPLINKNALSALLKGHCALC